MQFLSIKIYDQERKLNNNNLSRSFFFCFVFLRFKTATKGRQQVQHLGRRGSADGGAVVWAGVCRPAGRTLATAGRSNSFSRLDKCHHFIATGQGRAGNDDDDDDTQKQRAKIKTTISRLQ